MVAAILISTAILGAASDAPSPGAAATSAPDVAALLHAGGREGEERRAPPAWSLGAAAGSAGALVLADTGMLFAGRLLVGHTRGDCGAGSIICLSPTAVAIALAGVVLVPPTFAILVSDAIHEAPSTSRIALASAVQGGAVALFFAGASTAGHPARSALLASATALHLVGIPLSLGLAPARGAPGGEGLRGSPTLSLSMRW
jgi:hypothetical protein